MMANISVNLDMVESAFKILPNIFLKVNCIYVVFSLIINKVTHSIADGI